MFTYRKFVNLLIFIVSILAVNLITDRITVFLSGYKYSMHPAKATLVGMAIMVFILYPAFNWIDDFCEILTKKYFNAGKNAAGKITGVLLAFVVLIFILFLFYLDLWYNKTVLDLIIPSK
jgi:hypothetical protein